MMNNLPAIIDKIPEIDRTAPDLTVGRLPQWLTSSVLALGDEWHSPVLPAHKALSPAQIAEVERHVAVLEKAAQSGPIDRIGAAVSAMLSAFPSQPIGDVEATAKAGMYRTALEHVPAWSVERAVKFWMCRQHGEGRENYAFAASPPQLNRLAEVAYAPVLGELRKLRRLLAAKVERSLTHEERAANLARLRGILQPAGDAA